MDRSILSDTHPYTWQEMLHVSFSKILHFLEILHATPASRGKLPIRAHFWLPLFSRTMGLLFYNNGPIVLEQYPFVPPSFHCVTHGHVTGAMTTPYCAIVTSLITHTLLRNRDVINSFCVCFVPRLLCFDVLFRAFVSLRVCFATRLLCVDVSFRAFVSLRVCFATRLV